LISKTVSEDVAARAHLRRKVSIVSAWAIYLKCRVFQRLAAVFVFCSFGI